MGKYRNHHHFSSCHNMKMIWALVVICLFGQYVSNASSNERETRDVKVFTFNPDDQQLSPGSKLLLVWTHRVALGNIRWCYWQYRQHDINDKWINVVGFDAKSEKYLNISSKAQFYRFINEDNPCLGGLWSEGDDVNQLVGEYRMNLVVINGSVYTSPGANVNISDPTCEIPKTKGPWIAFGFVTFLLIIVAVGITLLMLSLFGKLPKRCNCWKKVRSKVRPDSTTQHLLEEHNVEDITELVSKLKKEKSELEQSLADVSKENEQNKGKVIYLQASEGKVIDENVRLRQKLDEKHKDKSKSSKRNSIDSKVIDENVRLRQKLDEKHKDKSKSSKRNSIDSNLISENVRLQQKPDEKHKDKSKSIKRHSIDLVKSLFRTKSTSDINKADAEMTLVYTQQPEDKV